MSPEKGVFRLEQDLAEKDGCTRVGDPAAHLGPPLPVPGGIESRGVAEVQDLVSRLLTVHEAACRSLVAVLGCWSPSCDGTGIRPQTR